MLEIQWYFFAAVFTLGAGYAFLRNVHVRIDFLSNKFSPRTRNWVDVGGILIFLFPLCYMMFTLTWPLLIQAYTIRRNVVQPGWTDPLAGVRHASRRVSHCWPCKACPSCSNAWISFLVMAPMCLPTITRTTLLNKPGPQK